MKTFATSKPFAIVLLLTLLGGCAIIANQQFDNLFGPAEPQQRMAMENSDEGKFFLNEVQPLIEKRCVVCHGCYDAPCQLKLSAAEGIDRGASPELIYNGTRLTAAETSRLFIDHNTTEEWRKSGFYPVLNERAQTAEANHQAGVMSRLLTLKQKHPLPEGEILPEQFDFAIDRDQQCPTAADMNNYEQEYSDWGMPFGLPALTKDENDVLQNWLLNGARMAQLPAMEESYQQQVSTWETFLNGESLKEKLVGRYLYEHWFLAHLYFSELPEGEYFRIVRSRTPPGQPIDVIATRRPYDDPSTENVFYRLWRERETILQKTHMPYALNSERLEKYSQLFLNDDYEVTKLPSYKPEVAANPFKSFEAIPTMSRYKFLLEEAQFTIMNFIKSPVCRGQVALNVINDHFWVFFVAPNEANAKDESSFYNAQQDNLALPSAAQSNAFILTNWIKYSELQHSYMLNKAKMMNKAFPNGEHLTTAQIWDGDNNNPNAALTIFRHIDSATVVKGLVGNPPQTAWVIDYALLERIHYLLAAGFDVYGNIGHQLNTRLYMDFLRIEGEFNFLALLPPDVRISELEHWYKGVSSSQRKYLMEPHELFMQPSGMEYKTDQPKQELYALLQERLNDVLTFKNDIENENVPDNQRKALAHLNGLIGGPVTLLPQITFLTVQDEDTSRDYTILRNNAHNNITSLLDEEDHRTPEFDTLTLTNGIVGAYPDVFINLDASQLEDYIQGVLSLKNETDYRRLMDKFAVRRTDANFWQHSDALNDRNHNLNPFNSGLLDYNRLQNR